MMYRWLLFISCLIWTTQDASGQEGYYPDSVRISILTCGPGDALYAIYGHNAIRVRDFSIGTDLVYNYGTFDFNTPGFALKFMRGKLPYLLSVARYEDFLFEYTYFQRDVIEQELELTKQQKTAVILFLNENMRPENRAYAYDFFQDNCATRLRDIIEKHTEGLIWPVPEDSLKTFRQIIKEYQQSRPWTDFGIDLILGAPADKVTTPREQAFIPDYLANMIGGATVESPLQKPLIHQVEEVLAFDNVPEKPFASGTPFFVFLLLLIGEIRFYFGSARTWQLTILKYADYLFFTLITIASLLMIFMWLGTDHSPTKDNWNILWANPLWPVWWYLVTIKKIQRRWMNVILQMALLVSFVNAIPNIQILPQYFHPAILPVTAILWMKMRRVSRR
jgi:hypothetical protein